MNGYINLDKEHSDFMSTLKKIGIKKIKLDKVKNQNQVDVVITSLSKYGETKKNLSNIESSNNPIPSLIVVNLSLIHI